MYKVLLDFDTCLQSYYTFINALEPDIHHMTSQILSVLIDILLRYLYHFLVIFQIFKS